MFDTHDLYAGTWALAACPSWFLRGITSVSALPFPVQQCTLPRTWRELTDNTLCISIFADHCLWLFRDQRDTHIQKLYALLNYRAM